MGSTDMHGFLKPASAGYEAEFLAVAELVDEVEGEVVHLLG